ncbi:hypothetical protein ACFQ1E_10210 [Sphingomonas canadensis]|uniref:DUF4412 domain-containing protein n=1 Tax=Sphingomonas canadensis TaxID=1219257 RepID=A0ABW3H7I1_9SPHN|nr:hypothetical protein [Sphingomonas canadensis]MCW3836507.1 hypothetical protein [Sphingomonas canadensis]
MGKWFRAAALALIAPLMLAGCLFMPGKFESTMNVRADRSFTFTYKGEVLAVDLAGMTGQMFAGLAAMGDKKEGEEGADTAPKGPSAEDVAKQDADNRELAAKLSKEPGYNKVEYRGNNVFYVDFSTSGTLTHSFVYPYNQDAGMVLPWVAIELRGKDMVRVKTPGFAKQDSSATGGMSSPEESKTDGVFTLTTDAEVVSQNNEEGGTKAGGVTTIRWTLTPATEDAPTAVLRVKSL